MTTEQFRVLDLGAHDGFVTNFIARKAKEAGRDLHIDGIEANLHGVALFNERMARDGITGTCKQGLAEDGPDLFRKHSYDAVVMYELLEHAPDVDALLSAAERMLSSKGRIYVSTPNGTFGAGSNPHHLRVWSMVDLFDLLRHRGTVHNALPGPDGVSVISYSPRIGGAFPRKEVAIFAGPGWEEWSAADIVTKGLGGSETAAAKVADALVPYDCNVTVFGEVIPGAVGQVVYRPYGCFDRTQRWDLVISSRIPELFAANIKADRKLLWLHDVDCGPRLTPELAERIDRIMCLSRWHHDHLLETYDWLDASKLYITRNGIEPSFFNRQQPDGSTIERNPHRAVYSSSPDRGLDLLLEWWPRVREAVPDAELVYAYPSVYDAVAQKDKRIAAFRNHIANLAEHTEGTTSLGSLTQPRVAYEMMRSGVWLAPSYSTPATLAFHETFCIGAVESAAAGCVRVMSQWGALEERDEHPTSFWVPPDPQAEGVYPNVEAFIESIIKAMTLAETEDVQQSDQAHSMDWQEVAADMLAACVVGD